MKVKDIIVETNTSKKGNEYTALYALLDNGKKVFIAFVK